MPPYKDSRDTILSRSTSYTHPEERGHLPQGMSAEKCFATKNAARPLCHSYSPDMDLWKEVCGDGPCLSAMLGLTKDRLEYKDSP